MRFLCDRSRLEAALGPILPAIPSKEPPQPALGCFSIEAADDALIVQGSNGELSIEVRLDDVKVDEPGRVLVPARHFASVVREVPDTVVRAQTEESRLEIPTSNGGFTIVLRDPDEFPELEFGGSDAAVEIPIETLRRHFASTEFACAREGSRYAINGLLVELRDGRMRTVGTDGRRLALIQTPLEQVDEGIEVRALLPHKAMQSAVRALDVLGDELCAIHVSPRAVVFTSSGASISMQQLVGDYPPFEAVIPRECESRVELNRPLFEANLRRVTVLTEDLNPAVEIAFEGGTARLSSTAPGYGSAVSSMEIDLNGPGAKIVFNPNYLMDALRVAEHDTVCLEFTGGSSATKFVLGEEFIYVVMPITGVG